MPPRSGPPLVLNLSFAKTRAGGFVEDCVARLASLDSLSPRPEQRRTVLRAARTTVSAHYTLESSPADGRKRGMGAAIWRHGCRELEEWMRSVSFQLSQYRDRKSQKSRSDLRSFGRRCCRFKRASCWRNARFSSARSERSRRADRTRENSRKTVRIMAAESPALGCGKSTASIRPGFWQMTGRRAWRAVDLPAASGPL